MGLMTQDEADKLNEELESCYIVIDLDQIPTIETIREHDLGRNRWIVLFAKTTDSEPFTNAGLEEWIIKAKRWINKYSRNVEHLWGDILHFKIQTFSQDELMDYAQEIKTTKELGKTGYNGCCSYFETGEPGESFKDLVLKFEKELEPNRIRVKKRAVKHTAQSKS